VFLIERAACKLFGVVTFGVHMTVYEQQKRDMGVDEHALGADVCLPPLACGIFLLVSHLATVTIIHCYSFA